MVYFDQDGNHLGDITVKLPYGIYVDSKNQLYINYTHNVSTNARGIAVYDINHTLVGQHVCQYGSGNNQMKNPFGITVDEYENIYVSDLGDNAIVIFEKD